MFRLFNNHGMSKTWGVILIFIVFLAAAGIGAILGYYVPHVAPLTRQVTEVFSPPFGGKDTVRILVLGEDNTGGKKDKPFGLSDTIMLVSINLGTNQVSVLSVPRDTRMDVDGSGREVKINASHVIGGPTMTALAVERLTGIRPDYYIKTNVKGFAKCVDILGGVEIDVEKNMRYNDNWGGLHINLKKGRQLLNGEKAMGYVRFRHDAMGDITRIQRQQNFMKVLAKKALSPANLPRLPQIISEIRKNVDTDMSIKDLYTLAQLPKKVDMSAVKTETLPGTPKNIGGVSYWVSDPEKTALVVQELFFTYTVPGLPKVEILNGSGVSGAAQQVAQALKDQGYEITNVGNADSFDYAYSQVITHKPDLQGLEQIAGIVNTTNIKQVDKQDQKSKADVTVIVGKDFVPISSGG